MPNRNSVNSGSLDSILLCGPAIFIYSGIMILPAFFGFYFSFTDWSGWGKKPNFIGLENFKELFQDEIFLHSIKITFLETVLLLIAFTFCAMILAVMLDKLRFMSGLIRGLIFYPYVLSILVGGLVFQWLGNYRSGAINVFLRNIGLENWTQEWMEGSFAPWFLFLFCSWQALGFFTMLYLANLQSIPQELYEAAELDGAGAVHTFKHIQFPLLMPTITTNSVLALIFGINLFGQVIVLWDKPRYDTWTIGYYIYTLGVEGNRLGYATAVSFVVFFILALIAIFQVWLLRKREVEL